MLLTLLYYAHVAHKPKSNPKNKGFYCCYHPNMDLVLIFTIARFVALVEEKKNCSPTKTNSYSHNII